MDRDPNTESKAQCLAELSSLSLPDTRKESRARKRRERSLGGKVWTPHSITDRGDMVELCHSFPESDQRRVLV